MRLLVACVGRLRDERLKGLASEYVTRLGRFTAVEVVEVPAADGKLPAARARSLEAAALRKVAAVAVAGRAGGRRRTAGQVVVGGQRAVIALDERGEMPGSRELADMLAHWTGRGLQQVSFLVGGDEGLEPALLSEADRIIALSRLTLTHEFARVLLLEQLYRGHAILAGHPYHRT